MTYATIGAGTINVRNATGAPGISLAALKCDAANVQRVVGNETVDINIPTINLKAVMDDFNGTVLFLEALI